MKTPQAVRPLLPILALLLSLVAAAPPAAATVDPLLAGLLQPSADKTAARPILERMLVTQATADPADPLVAVLLRLAGPAAALRQVPGLRLGSSAGGVATARLPLSSLAALIDRPEVLHVQGARLLQPLLDQAVPAANVDQAWLGTPAYTGAGVLVGILDTGIDWDHADFENPDGSTRIVAIWDQFASGTPPAGFDYGAEITAARIDAGLASERDYQGHGTHVAGIAAGNGRASGGTYAGVAPGADLLIAKPFDDELGGFPSDAVLDAMNYLVQKAAALGRPLVVNLSLGAHFGAHDGTDLQELLIDELSGPGVVFCIAAGNEGVEYVHDQTSADGGTLRLEVPAYTPASGALDYLQLDIWADGAACPSVSLAVDGATYGPYAPGFSGGQNTAAGTLYVDNASGGADPENGDWSILIQVSDQLGTVPADGEWTLTFSGATGTVHAWKSYATVTLDPWFPDSDQAYSVSVPATAAEGIAVAAWKTRNSWPSLAGLVGYASNSLEGRTDIGDRAPFSSLGPTRDGRQKPDLIAPGMAIVASRSWDITPTPGAEYLVAGGECLVNQGTSMAAPFAAGVTALLLQKNPALTAAEVRAGLIAGAATDAFTGAVWNAEFGHGKIDAVAALAAVAAQNPPGDGDLDGDAVVTVLDVILLVNAIVDPGGHPLDAEQLLAADVYPAAAGDGILDVLDLARLVGIILGTETAPAPEAGTGPAVLTLGQPVHRDDGWFVEAVFSGPALTAGQFALTGENVTWEAAGVRIREGAGVQVAARAVGRQLRVVLVDPAGELPAAGVTLELPLGDGVATPGGFALSGALAAGRDGTRRTVTLAVSPQLSAGFLEVGPNPAPGAATVRFGLGRARPHTLAVYDLRGRRVRLLAAGSGTAGATLQWDGRDDGGRRLPSGLYLVRLQTDDAVFARKIVLGR